MIIKRKIMITTVENGELGLNEWLNLSSKDQRKWILQTTHTWKINLVRFLILRVRVHHFRKIGGCLVLHYFSSLV